MDLYFNSKPKVKNTFEHPARGGKCVGTVCKIKYLFISLKLARKLHGGISIMQIKITA